MTETSNKTSGHIAAAAQASSMSRHASATLHSVTTLQHVITVDRNERVT